MERLTERELTCLSWAASGKTSWEVGVIMDLSERTINFHISNACKKLGVYGRQAAITAAMQAGALQKHLNGLLAAPEKTARPEPEDTKTHPPQQPPRPARRKPSKPRPEDE
jgi:LuxR family transcriptional regulator of spore coat protein